MNIKTGNKVKYESAAGTITGIVEIIFIAATAKPNFSNVFMTIVVDGNNVGRKATIPADDSALKMFKVEVLS